MSQSETIAYTDGSCLGNPGPGGWGVHVESAEGRVIELGGAEHATTNNRMELRAAIEALRVTSGESKIVVITDSQYVRRGVLEWLALWKRKEWRTATGEPVQNQQLWLELDALVDERVSWRWTRGHAGTPGNERCDEIARWFASSVRPLKSGPLPVSVATARTLGRDGVTYLSLVDGVVARHRTWADCERRVHGARGARYRKARSSEEERQIVADWGLSADALIGVDGA